MASLRLSVVLTLALSGMAGCAGVRKNNEVIHVDSRLGFRSARQLTQAGVRHVHRGNMEKAEASFKNAIRADETYGPAHNNLGRVYFQLGDLKLSAEAFSWAMEFMPERPEPVNNLGLTYETAGRLNEAIGLYQTAHIFAPNNPEYLANLVRARFRRGDRGDDLRDGFRALQFIEVRPEWANWVNQQLALSFNNRTDAQQQPSSSSEEIEQLPESSTPVPTGQLPVPIGPSSDSLRLLPPGLEDIYP